MGIAVYFIWHILESVPLFYIILEEPMESFLRMLNAQMILLVYLAVGMYCVKVGLIDRDSKEKLVDIILRITLPCMIFNSFNKPLTPEVMKQTALILVVAVSISILSFLLGKVIYNKYPQKKKSILQYCTLATIPVLMLFL